jgi:hypothetical protein
MGAEGLEPLADSRGNQGFADRALQNPVHDDARLARLVAVWPALPEDVRDAVLRLVENTSAR